MLLRISLIIAMILIVRVGIRAIYCLAAGFVAETESDFVKKVIKIEGLNAEEYDIKKFLIVLGVLCLIYCGKIPDGKGCSQSHECYGNPKNAGSFPI